MTLCACISAQTKQTHNETSGCSYSLFEGGGPCSNILEAMNVNKHMRRGNQREEDPEDRDSEHKRRFAKG